LYCYCTGPTMITGESRIHPLPGFSPSPFLVWEVTEIPPTASNFLSSSSSPLVLSRPGPCHSVPGDGEWGSGRRHRSRFPNPLLPFSVSAARLALSLTAPPGASTAPTQNYIVLVALLRLSTFFEQAPLLQWLPWRGVEIRSDLDCFLLSLVRKHWRVDY